MSVTTAPLEDGSVPQEYSAALDEMKHSMSSTREVIKALQAKLDASELDMKDGISLLSTKAQVMVSYLQSLSILSARRALGHSLLQRSSPSESFASTERGPRGDGAGDRVDAMIEGRVALEKIKVLEGRMRYQIDKLVRVADESAESAQNAVNDPLAFKPNPDALLNDGMSEDEESADERREVTQKSGVYHPPKLAPMPYLEPQKKKEKQRRGPVPNALANLAHLDPHMPHAVSSSGLGATPAQTSARARELQRMTEFEEENMTRLLMKKKDANRRMQDEADLALGGTGITGRNGRGAGLEGEFGDILRSVGRTRSAIHGDGYDELRQKGKKQSVLARSRTRSRDDVSEGGGDDGPRQRKKSRFEKEVKAAKKRTSGKMRKS